MRHIVGPSQVCCRIAPSIVSAWLVAFTVSLDEFALALFLAGTDVTFPVYLFGQLRYASRLPMMIAFAVLMMMVTLLLVLIAEWIRRRGQRAKSGRPGERRFPQLRKHPAKRKSDNRVEQ